MQNLRRNKLSKTALLGKLTAGLSELRPQPDPLGTAAFRSLSDELLFSFLIL